MLTRDLSYRVEITILMVVYPHCRAKISYIDSSGKQSYITSRNLMYLHAGMRPLKALHRESCFSSIQFRSNHQNEYVRRARIIGDHETRTITLPTKHDNTKWLILRDSYQKTCCPSCSQAEANTSRVKSATAHPLSRR